MLTDNEKAGIINSHIRNIEINKYNAQTSIMTEEALESPNADFIDLQNNRIAQFDLQITVLNAELAKLNITDETDSYTTVTSTPEAPQG